MNTFLGIFKSKTMWFNILAFLILIANQFGFSAHEVPAGLDQAAMFVVIIGNMILRGVTKKPLAEK